MSVFGPILFVHFHISVITNILSHRNHCVYIIQTLTRPLRYVLIYLRLYQHRYDRTLRVLLCHGQREGNVIEH